MYNEETQERGVELMVSHGFPMGRIIHPVTDKVVPNALVSTVEDGPFWSGDLSESEIGELIKVATQMNRVLICKSQTGSKALIVTNQPSNS